MGHYIGIDLGTTTSGVAVCGSDGTPRMINVGSQALIDSIVAYDYRDGVMETLVGKSAKGKRSIRPGSVAFESKRLMDTVPKTPVLTEIGKTPVDVAADILRYLKGKAEEHLGARIDEAFITVPASFTDLGKSATREAGAQAGFKNLTLLQEPVAAALAYLHTDGLDVGDRLFVFDFGGGTLDTAILKVTSEDLTVEVFNGDARLGGSDFDEVMYEILHRKFEQHYGVSLDPNKKSGIPKKIQDKARARLRELAEITKISLSTLSSTTVDQVLFVLDDGEDVEEYKIEATIHRSEFERACAPLLERARTVVEETLKGVSVESITRVAMVGGSSRMPMLRSMLETLVSIPVFGDSMPDELVAKGAARYHWMCNTPNSPRVSKVSAHSLGIRVYGDRMSLLMPKGTPLPAEQIKMYSTAKDYQELIRFRIFMGESVERCSVLNKQVGEVTLRGIRRGLANEPYIRVTFRLSDEDILTFHARDEHTGKCVETSLVRPWEIKS